MKKVKIEPDRDMNINNDDPFNLTAKWVANLSDGNNLTSEDYESLLDIGEVNLRKIRALRLNTNGMEYTISRNIRIKNSETGKLEKLVMPGFFYHGKYGVKFVKQGTGNYLPDDVKIQGERIGFCYNNNADAVVVSLDYKDFYVQLNMRLEQISMLNEALNVYYNIKRYPKLVAEFDKYKVDNASISELPEFDEKINWYKHQIKNMMTVEFYTKKIQDLGFYIGENTKKIENVSAKLEDDEFINNSSDLSYEDRKKELKQIKFGYIKARNFYEIQIRNIKQVLKDVKFIRKSPTKNIQNIRDRIWRLDSQDVKYNLTRDITFENVLDKPELSSGVLLVKTDGIQGGCDSRYIVEDIVALPKESISLPKVQLDSAEVTPSIVESS